MKHLKLLLLFTLLSAFAYGQKSPTLPPGNVAIQIYKNRTTDLITAGSAAAGFDVLAPKRKQDSLYAILVAGLDLKVDKDGTKVLSDVNFSTAKDTKLSGIATGATANQTDAYLLDRTNHTGSQAISTVTGLQTALDGKQASLGFTPENLANKATAGGYASLDGSGRVPLSQLPTGTQTYVGTWNASTNTPTLANGTGTLGQYYIVNVPGTQNLGAGSDTYALGDNVIYSGTVWEKVPNSGGVTAVNGMTGAVSLTTANIPESGNLYYTEGRVSANTNVAANTAARHSPVTIGTANGLSLSTQALSLGLASTSTNGALSSTDWNTFNSKQPAGSYEPSFSKNTAFNKNFGTASGTVAEGNDSRINNGQTAFGWGNHAGLYPTYNGTGATGTWGINISGNAATATNSTNWGGYPFSFTNGAVNSYVMSYNGTGFSLSGATELKTFLGIPSGGETLQSVTDRGSSTTIGIASSSFIGTNGASKLWTISNDANRWYLAESGVDTWVAVAKTSGNVGIGTASPSAKLDVNGTGNFVGNVTAPTFIGNLTGNASTASSVAWTGVSSRPTALSQFTNDLGLGSAAYESPVQAPTPSTIPQRTVDGYLTAETAPPGTSSTVVANTAFVQNAIAASTASSGAYTPTLTATDNITSITNNGAFYQRIGNIVTVTGKCYVTATSANTITAFNVSLPSGSTSNFTTTDDAHGVTSGYWQSFGSGGTVYSETVTDTIRVMFNSGTSFGFYLTYSSTYIIK